MPDQIIQYTEEMVGAGHPTKADTLNRLVLVDHNADGTHNFSLPMGHLSGLTLAHAADTDHDITVAAGKARCDADSYDLVLASAMTKQADATHAPGTNQGGMAAGETLPTSGTIHLWLIKGTSGVDLMYNNNATSGLSPTLPAGYNQAKRRIGSYRTDASANIINGARYGTGLTRRFELHTPILDVNIMNGSTSAQTVALSTPGGIVVGAKIIAMATYAAGWVSSLVSTDIVPSGGTGTTSNCSGTNTQIICTNTLSQIRYRISSTGAGEIMSIATHGWEEYL